jgi:hypothetical protein
VDVQNILKGLGILEHLLNSYLIAQIILFDQLDKYHSRNYLVTTLYNAAFLASRAHHQAVAVACRRDNPSFTLASFEVGFYLSMCKQRIQL